MSGFSIHGYENLSNGLSKSGKRRGRKCAEGEFVKISHPRFGSSYLSFSRELAKRLNVNHGDRFELLFELKDSRYFKLVRHSAGKYKASIYDGENPQGPGCRLNSRDLEGLAQGIYLYLNEDEPMPGVEIYEFGLDQKIESKSRGRRRPA